MDSIDITDSAFSLGIPDVNTIVSTGETTSDYTIFIYIGVAIVLAFIAMFVYKFYMNKQKKSDCDGGFCTINENTHSIGDQ
jgi:hypothetical protein